MRCGGAFSAPKECSSTVDDSAASRGSGGGKAGVAAPVASGIEGGLPGRAWSPDVVAFDEQAASTKVINMRRFDTP